MESGYHCTQCDDFDLCSACFVAFGHFDDHEMKMFDNNSTLQFVALNENVTTRVTRQSLKKKEHELMEQDEVNTESIQPRKTSKKTPSKFRKTALSNKATPSSVRYTLRFPSS